MKDKKEIILEAYKEGKTIQYNHSGEWKDFIPHNQLDRPNLNYGTLDNWRVKPTLEEILPNQIWNDKKKEGIKKVILEHKVDRTVEQLSWELAKEKFEEKCNYSPNLDNSQDLLVVSSIQEGILIGMNYQNEKIEPEVYITALKAYRESNTIHNDEETLLIEFNKWFYELRNI